MKKIKKVLAVALVGVLGFSITGCKMIARTPESIRNTVLAKVGDVEITRGDVDKELKPQLDQLVKQYGENYEEDPQLQIQLKNARTQVLQSLVDEKVLVKKAEELKLVPAQDELDKEIKERTDNLIKMYGSEEAFNKAKESFGYTDETYNEFIKNQVIAQKAKDYMFKDIKVTDEEVQKYYDENKANFGEANVSHILVGLDGRTDEEAKAGAEEVRQKAVNGEDFAVLAKEYSDDPGSKDKGGDYGVIPYDSQQFVKEFVDGFKSLGEGEISEPVKSEFGYHVIKATNVKKKSFDEVKEEIKSKLEKEQQDKIYTETLKKWKEELGVKIYDDKI